MPRATWPGGPFAARGGAPPFSGLQRLGSPKAHHKRAVRNCPLRKASLLRLTTNDQTAMHLQLAASSKPGKRRQAQAAGMLLQTESVRNGACHGMPQGDQQLCSANCKNKRSANNAMAEASAQALHSAAAAAAEISGHLDLSCSKGCMQYKVVHSQVNGVTN